MIYIVTALAQEAIPLIQHFKLKKDLSHTKFDIYRSDMIKLIVSGTGKLKSAVATTYLLLKEPPKKSDKILNFGICGSGLEKHKSGQVFLINKIEDLNSGKTYYPEILFSHLLPEAGIITHEKPVIKSKTNPSTAGLVDMEVSGFYESANTFVQSHNIIILKVVSDHLSGEKFTGAFIQSIVEKNIPHIITVLNQSRKRQSVTSSDAEVLDSGEYRIFEDLSEDLGLSTTQRFQVLDLIKGYKVRGDGDLKFLKEYSKSKKITSKQDTKKALDELREKLDTGED
jgi:nucleoside phosphorylase